MVVVGGVEWQCGDSFESIWSHAHWCLFSLSFLFRCTGKWQIIGTIFLAESFAELQKPHYMMGGPTAELIWPKVDSSGISADVMRTKQNRELNNGRLAMIAIMSFLSEHAIPGSVPVLAKIDAFH